MAISGRVLNRRPVIVWITEAFFHVVLVRSCAARIKEVGVLVLTRRVGESIVVDGHKITVVSIAIGRVKLGIEAPRHVPVHRLEVYERERERETAA